MQNVDFEITPLGGASGIGGSCFLVRMNGTTIILDAGLRPDKTGFSAVPLFDRIRDTPDAIIISHAHLDHVGALPLLCSGFPDTPVYATSATADISRITLQDSYMLMERYPEKSSRGFESHYFKPRMIPEWNTVDFYVKKSIRKGVSFTFFPAGHIAGAAGILLETEDFRFFYTGDFKIEKQILVPGADFPSEDIDVLMTESTYGRESAIPSFENSTKDFLAKVAATVNKEGNVLIPAFAVGRTQEVLAMLLEAKEQGHLPEDTYIWCGGMGRKINTVYKRGGFCSFDGVFSVSRVDQWWHQLDHAGKNVIVATSANLNEGTMSASVAKKIMSRKNSKIIFCGHIFESTNASRVFNAKSQGKKNVELTLLKGKLSHVDMNMFDVIPLTAHASYLELKKNIINMKPKNVVFVHGEPDSLVAIQGWAKRRGIHSTIPADSMRMVYDTKKEKMETLMSKTAIITTVGTSLLTNMKKQGTSGSMDSLVGLCEKHPYSASAETNSLSRIAEKRGGFRAGMRNSIIYLVHSGIKGADVCARVIRDWLDDQSVKAELVKVDGLDPEKADVFQKTGLMNFIDSVCDIVEDHGTNALINATGGFKAQISMATVLGVLYKIPIYYMFEGFDDVVEMPQLPITFDAELMKRSYESIRELLEGIGKRQTYERLDDAMKPFILYNKQYKTYSLSAMGKAFMRAYEYGR